MENEKRLIDATEARKHSTHDIITHFLDRCPTVDAVEVVHSRWVNIVTICDGLCIGFCEKCRTEQKAQNATALKAYHKYCRWCGAKMDGGNEDGKRYSV